MVKIREHIQELRSCRPINNNLYSNKIYEVNLSQLHKGQTAYIATVQGSPSFRLRLEEMGFVPGQEVTCSYSSPLGTPIVYAMLGQKVALRRSEAQQISVTPTMSEASAAIEDSVAD